MLGLGLSIPQVAVRGGGVDPIAELFARLGGTGTWVDPLAGQTVFSDTAGTTQAVPGGMVARIDAAGGVQASFQNAVEAQQPLLRADGLEFDGVDDRLVYPDDPALRFGTTSFTVAGACSPADLDPGNNFMFDKRGTGASDPTRRGWGVERNGKSLRLFIDDGNSLVVGTVGANVFTLNTWLTWLIDIDRAANTATARINGVAQTPVAIPTGDISGAKGLHIGSSADAASFGFAGRIGRLLVLDKLLSDADKTTAEAWLQGGFA